MSNQKSKHSQTFSLPLGLGCFLAFVFLIALGPLSFSDFDFAFAHQLPLTLTSDLGCLAGIALLALAKKHFTRNETLRNSMTPFAAAGMALGSLIKAGVLVPQSTVALLAGDFFVALCVTIVAFQFWTLFAQFEEPQALKSFGAALGIGTMLFLALSIMPSGIARILFAAGLPFAAAALSLPSIARAEQRPRQEKNGKLPRIVAIIIAMAAFVVDFLMDLFPIALYYESSLINSLTEPAAVCAGLFAAFAVVLFLFGLKGAAMLPPLYFVGFFLVTIGYLTTPYRFAGGIPLGLAETGRFIIFVFLLIVCLRLAWRNDEGGVAPEENEAATAACSIMPPEDAASDVTTCTLGSESASAAADALFLKGSAIAFASMAVTDVIVVAMQLQPGFDYSDFVFRTAFAGVGMASLVALVLGPLSRIEATITKPEANLAGAPDQAATNAPLSPQDCCVDFARLHRLTARETEILTLIANGRDVPYIERELVLAKSTVKTHIKHIYEKCSVSSRQDLLDLLEEFSEQQR